MAKKQSLLVQKVVLKFTSGDYGLGLYSMNLITYYTVFSCLTFSK